MRLAYSFIFLLLLMPAALVFATDPSSISVQVVPPNPAPKESVTVSLGSFSINLDTVKIDWLEDGKTVLSGIGQKSYTTLAKSASTETRVGAIINMPDGQIIKSIIIRPTVMTLLWQANDSYVPPFYKGKALPAPGSEIKIVAMPEIRVSGTTVNPKNLSYDWRQDYTNQPAGSGYGRNYFIYNNDYLENSSTVSVTASTTDQRYSSENSTAVGASLPKILFYKIDSLVGILWEDALLDTHTMAGEEVIFGAPYFISPKNTYDPRLVFKWFINNIPTSVSIVSKNILPLRAPAGTSGTSKVRLEIENTEQLFSTAKKEIKVEF